MKQAGVMLIVKDGLILAISRRHDKTIFGLPGGSFSEELGDKTIVDTAIRECKEETSVVVNHCVQIYQRVEPGDGNKKVDFYSTTYYATEWKGDPTNSEEGEVCWLTVEELTSTKAAFGGYNRQMLNHFKLMFPDIKLIGEESCCQHNCKTKHEMRIVHGDPQQFWEALLEANTDGFISMEEARLGYQQYLQLYDAAPEEE